jgi:hypothetical protein
MTLVNVNTDFDLPCGKNTPAILPETDKQESRKIELMNYEYGMK